MVEWGIILISLLTGLMVILNQNAVIAVFNLILLYIIVALYLMYLGITYIGISYIIVYIGAIAILFLFIIMMIDIEISQKKYGNYVPLLAFSFLSLIIAFLISFKYDPLIKYTNLISFSFNWDSTIMKLTQISIIGDYLYSNYFIFIYILSIILLLAMIGAILLTELYDKNTDNTYIKLKPIMAISVLMNPYIWISLSLCLLFLFCIVYINRTYILTQFNIIKLKLRRILYGHGPKRRGKRWNKSFIPQLAVAPIIPGGSNPNPPVPPVNTENPRGPMPIETPPENESNNESESEGEGMEGVEYEEESGNESWSEDESMEDGDYEDESETEAGPSYRPPSPGDPGSDCYDTDTDDKHAHYGPILKEGNRVELTKRYDYNPNTGECTDPPRMFRARGEMEEHHAALRARAHAEAEAQAEAEAEAQPATQAEAPSPSSPAEAASAAETAPAEANANSNPEGVSNPVGENPTAFLENSHGLDSGLSTNNGFFNSISDSINGIAKSDFVFDFSFLPGGSEMGGIFEPLKVPLDSLLQIIKNILSFAAGGEEIVRNFLGEVHEIWVTIYPHLIAAGGVIINTSVYVFSVILMLFSYWVTFIILRAIIKEHSALFLFSIRKLIMGILAKGLALREALYSKIHYSFSFIIIGSLLSVSLILLYIHALFLRFSQIAKGISKINKQGDNNKKSLFLLPIALPLDIAWQNFEIYFYILLILAFILWFINLLFSIRNLDMDKGRGFECGLQSFFQTREQFHISFHRVSLLFLAFDLEIVIIYPGSVSDFHKAPTLFFNLLVFLIILMIGFIYEISVNALDIYVPFLKIYWK